jgi:hypothetical protein
VTALAGAPQAAGDALRAAAEHAYLKGDKNRARGLPKPCRARG